MNKKIRCIIMAVTVCLGGSSIQTMATTNTVVLGVEPQKAAYGYFVDEYRKNDSIYNTPDVNPAIGVLSGFLELWQPGDLWDNGIKLNESILNSNIQKSIAITANLTESEKYYTYLYDRRHQSYSAIGGLKEYASVFKEKTNAGTTIIDKIPDDATTVKYDDKGNSNGTWADTDGEYGSMVQLVNAVRGNNTSSNPSKSFYSYMRPFRWSNDVTVLDTLVPCKKPVENAASDGGFPSGHTNAAYLASLGFAYSTPEKFNDLIFNASELGHSRVLAGMHSPLDVIGGRVLGTALSAAVLNNPETDAVKAAAYEEARQLLSEEVEVETIDEKIATYKANKSIYLERLTYGFDKIGESGKEMIVPKGAEVLIETRYPYLDETQRRYVLKTTGIDSGYPVLDDIEGWGRLNLFEAANGYGSFETDVTVNMDASEGGLNAEDSWLNDIDGEGSLTKLGSGLLILAGNNTYTGGTNIEDGSLIAYSETALGNGEVQNTGGTLSEKVNGTVVIKKDFTQEANGILNLSLESDNDCLVIEGEATLDGTLKIIIEDDYELGDKVKIVEYSSLADEGTFNSIEFEGVPAGYDAKVVYQEDGIYLVNESVELAANIEELKSLIKKAEALDAEDYTVDSYEEVVNAIKDAKITLESEYVTNELVLEAITKLNKVMDNLEKNTTKPVDPENPNTDNNNSSNPNTNNSTSNGNKPGKLPQTGGISSLLKIALGVTVAIGGKFTMKKKK